MPEHSDPEARGRLRVLLVQRASSLDPAENRGALSALASEAVSTADLVVWPEAFARDFGEPDTPLGPYAEPLDGPFATALAAAAAEHRNHWLAGMFETSSDPERPYNTLLWAGPENRREQYRKIHLYDSFGFAESDRVSGGPLHPTVLDLNGFPIGLMTCYDLRFPELARAVVDEGAEAIVLPAAWVAGEGKLTHWRTLVRARAIENTCWVIAVGQPGPRYTGHSLVVSPTGEVLTELGGGPDEVSVEIDRASVAAARRTNPSLQNRRL